MKSVLMTLLPAVAGTVLAQGPQAPGATNVLELFPLQHLCAPGEQLTPLHWSTMLSTGAMFDGEEPDLLHVLDPDGAQFDADWIMSLLQEWNEAALDDGRLDLACDQGVVRLRGEPRAVATVRQQLRDLAKVLARPLRVEAAVWRIAGDAPLPTVLTPEGYARFQAEHELLWRGMTTTRSARPVALDSSRWTDYVRDIDVEIAQKSFATDPQPDAFFEGAYAAVMPHALVGDDGFVLQTQMTWAERVGPVRLLSTDIPKSANVEAPLVHSACAAFAGRVRNGGALCATLRGDPGLGTNCVFTVSVAAAAPPQSVELPGGAFPVSALTNGALLDRTRFRPSLHFPSQPLGYDIAVEGSDLGHGRIDPDALVELVVSAFTDEQQEDLRVEQCGGYLLVRGPGDTVQRTEALLAGLESVLLRNAGVSQRTQLVGPPGVDEPGTLLDELTLPTMPGRFVTAMRRRETNVIHDVDVEVAQSADVTDPKVSILQGGAWLQARVALLDDAAHLQLDGLLVDCVLGQARSLVPDGAIVLPSIASQRVTYGGPAAAGAPLRHGDGPVIVREGHPCRSEVVTTVNW